MPYKMSTKGMDEINKMLGKLDSNANAIATHALYEGAGIVADELNRQANAIRTEPFKYARGGERRLPSPEEKDAIMGAVGIAHFQNEGGAEVNTSVGYNASGYADVAGKVRPIPLIVNAINSGTSFMQKQPFVRKAANSGGQKAVATMTKYIEGELEKIIKE